MLKKSRQCINFRMSTHSYVKDVWRLFLKSFKPLECLHYKAYTIRVVVVLFIQNHIYVYINVTVLRSLKNVSKISRLKVYDGCSSRSGNNSSGSDTQLASVVCYNAFLPIVYAFELLKGVNFFCLWGNMDRHCTRSLVRSIACCIVL